MSPAVSTVLKHPNEVFLTPPAPPHPWTYSMPSPPSAPSLPWKTCNSQNIELIRVLSRLQLTLRSLHKHKVSWPADESWLTTLPSKEYLRHLLQPIANMYNELQTPGAFPHPVECVDVDLGDCLNSATFEVHQAKLRSQIPIIVSFPGTLFNACGAPYPQTLYAVAQAIDYNSDIQVVIATNYEDIAIFQPSEHTYTRISTCQAVLALRVVTMAYMNFALPWGYNIRSVQPDFGDEVSVVQGPPMDPNQPLMSDEQVFETHHRCSDFDEPTLLNDRARASQFFRWLKHVRQHCSKTLIHPGNKITATTHAVPLADTDVNSVAQPLYPFMNSDLPPQTTAHVQAIQRESPLAAFSLDHALGNSRSFSLEIDNIISEGSDRSISTVYRCRIISIDDQLVSESPSLCLKLFDDRFQPRECPDDDDDDEEEDEMDPNDQVDANTDEAFATFDNGLGIQLGFATNSGNYDEYHNYLSSLVHADQLVMTETAAYDKLLPVQGSLVPWFYGVHKFVLPDGMYVYGILMEYLEGIKLNSHPESEISTERQAALIQSCRHGARVLDVADIHQFDWHSGQIFLHTNPTSKIDHAVFFDFALTTQTYTIDQLVYIDNYVQVLMVLLGVLGYTWVNGVTVWENYGEPDDWDPVKCVLRRGEESVMVEARNRFAFISTVDK